MQNSKFKIKLNLSAMSNCAQVFLGSVREFKEFKEFKEYS